MKLPYTEGSVFLVPLRSGRFARGVVARATPRGRVIYGYFFGPPLPSTKNVPLDDLSPKKALLQLRFGDLGLISGDWRVCGKVPLWDRAEWAMPGFVRRNPLTAHALLVRYSDGDPNKIDTAEPCQAGCELPTDSLSGYRAVEIKLSQILK